jgi:DNA-binding transcriptional LysR family regulator
MSSTGTTGHLRHPLLSRMSGDTSDGGIPSRAQQLSFRKAARTLYVTQLAVTLQVKTLEEELGLKLLEQSSTGVSLTEVGKLLLRDAEQHHQLAVQAENRLAALKGQAAASWCLALPPQSLNTHYRDSSRSSQERTQRVSANFLVRTLSMSPRTLQMDVLPSV